MFYLLLFFTELLILFFLSKFVTRSLSYLFYRITKSEKVMVYVMALFFFPGTLIHELAHYLTAAALFVHVGKMEFVPKVMGSGVKMGSVEIGQSDPIRRAVIGMAPFIWGTLLMLLVLSLFQHYGGRVNIGITLLTGYVLFEISNTMFSSRKDMEGTLELLVFLLILSVMLYLIGVRVPASVFTYLSREEVVRIFQTGSYFLLVPLGIDIVLLTILKLLRKLYG